MQDGDDRYLILSSDAHAGAPLRGYRDHLGRSWHDESDRCVAVVVNPWHDVYDTRNWDSDDRLAAWTRSAWPCRYTSTTATAPD